AEDGIRDRNVTGVQTCALPILIVAESFARTLTAFDIAADGSLSNRRVWAGVPGDGICLDAAGAIWCSEVAPAGGGVVVRVAEGEIGRASCRERGGGWGVGGARV